MANTRSLRNHLKFIDLIGIRFYLADTYSFSCYNDLKDRSPFETVRDSLMT
jgi:hypothetical protein